ncbi:aminotransferase-like domain-containing protein [Salinicola avicenniae]|uniref:aminotransferase-like domain-containing protein n=1 Tax=Salinicola avicenniae TaxID=2916836 RepID=UPI0020744462|nr:MULTISPECIES: PLP-dependent aminotransferase family protein [unclassified Salinicola]
MTEESRPWVPRLGESAQPLYRSIADAIAEDIATGRLKSDQQLPTQRQLAERLGINFTTVTRAYNEARKRGLIEARVGRGSFVRQLMRPRILHAQEEKRVVDMTMNLPPEPIEGELDTLMQAGFDALKPNLNHLLRYQDFGGTQADREAGVRWLSQRWKDIEADQLLVCPGAQSALLSIFTLLKATAPGATICCASLTYPGLRALAAQFGVSLVGLPMDDEGIDAGAFAAACAQHAPKALYCNPTLHNPTTITVSARRRVALAEVARHYQVPIIEDDAYGMLPKQTMAPLATHAPELTFYIAGLAKCMGAGLRLAYVVAPGAIEARRLADAMRATTVMASPLNAALATEWIRTGAASSLLDAIRREAIARQKIVAELLPAASYCSQPEAFHLWITLTPHWTRAAFSHRLGTLGISVVPSDAFAVSEVPPEAVRVCLGGDIDRQALRRALGDISRTLESLPEQQVGII